MKENIASLLQLLFTPAQSTNNIYASLSGREDLSYQERVGATVNDGIWQISVALAALYHYAMMHMRATSGRYTSQNLQKYGRLLLTMNMIMVADTALENIFQDGFRRIQRIDQLAGMESVMTLLAIHLLLVRKLEKYKFFWRAWRAHDPTQHATNLVSRFIKSQSDELFSLRHAEQLFEIIHGIKISIDNGIEGLKQGRAYLEEYDHNTTKRALSILKDATGDPRLAVVERVHTQLLLTLVDEYDTIDSSNTAAIQHHKSRMIAFFFLKQAVQQRLRPNTAPILANTLDTQWRFPLLHLNQIPALRNKVQRVLVLTQELGVNILEQVEDRIDCTPGRYFTTDPVWGRFLRKFEKMVIGSFAANHPFCSFFNRKISDILTLHAIKNHAIQTPGLLDSCIIGPARSHIFLGNKAYHYAQIMKKYIKHAKTIVFEESSGYVRVYGCGGNISVFLQTKDLASLFVSSKQLRFRPPLRSMAIVPVQRLPISDGLREEENHSPDFGTIARPALS